MIKLRQKGDFKKLNNYLEKTRESVGIGFLDKYGKLGVEALKEATPKDTGKTAESWYYIIERGKGYVTLSFWNSNVVNKVPIAIILQYGHGTRNGGYVRGIDYINPALKPIFDEIVNKAWKEVTKV